MKGSWLNSICMKWEEELHQFTTGWFLPFRRCCFCNSLATARARVERSLSNGVAVAGSATLHLANSERSAHGVWQHLARGAVAFPFVEEPEAHRLRQVKHPADARTAICILDCGVWRQNNLNSDCFKRQLFSSIALFGTRAIRVCRRKKDQIPT